MAFWKSTQRRSVFGSVLRDCRKTEGITHKQLARRLIARDFPSHHHSTKPAGSAEDVSWLAERLRDIEKAGLAEGWPFEEPPTAVIDSLAAGLPSVLEASWRLTAAEAIDTLRREELQDGASTEPAQPKGDPT